MNEFIVYIKMMKNKRIIIGRARSTGLDGMFQKSLSGQSWKLIYFESRKSMRSAEMLERKLGSMTRIRLLNEIRKSNPELLDLKYALNNTNFIQEII